MGPHDGRFKLFFSFRRMMADLVRGFLRAPWLDGLDLETLEPAPASLVSRRLRQKHGDCLWRARFTGPDGASTWLYLWIEFQSQPDQLRELFAPMPESAARLLPGRDPPDRLPGGYKFHVSRIWRS